MVRPHALCVLQAPRLRAERAAWDKVRPVYESQQAVRDRLDAEARRTGRSNPLRTQTRTLADAIGAPRLTLA